MDHHKERKEDEQHLIPDDDDGDAANAIGYLPNDDKRSLIDQEDHVINQPPPDDDDGDAANAIGDLPDDDKRSLIDHEDHVINQPPPPSINICSKILSGIRCITIEPPLILLVLTYSSMIGMRMQYMRQDISAQFGVNITDPDAMQAACLTPGSNTSEGVNDTTINAEIQSQLADMDLMLSAVESFPAFFSITLFGALSDRIGRKIVMLIPIAGYMISCLLYIVIMSQELSIMLFLVAAVVQGCTGGFGLFVAVGFSYIVNITPKMGERTFRLVVIQVSITLTSGISSVGLGYFLRAYGFPATMWVTFGFSALSFLYILNPYVIREPRSFSSSQPVVSQGTPSEETEETKPSKLQKMTIALKKIYLMFKDNTDDRRKLLVTGILALFIVGMAQNQVFSMTILYSMGQPFCWLSVVLGYFAMVHLMAEGLGALISSKLLAMCLPQIIILHLSLMDSILVLTVISASTATFGLFLSCPLGFIRGLYQPVLKTMMSGWVGKDEQGTLFACIGGLGAIGSFIAPLVANGIYSATVRDYPAFVFYFFIGMYMIPVLLTILLHVFIRGKNNSRRPCLDINSATEESDTDTK